MEIEEMKFRVLYDGIALDSHQMDAKDLAPALLAISDTIDIAAKQIYGEKTKISIKVNASFKAGSFGIDFTLASLIQDAITFFTSGFVSATLNIAGVIGLTYAGTKMCRKGVIQLIKWINGRNITKIVPTDKDNVIIYIGDEFEEYDLAVLQLFKNYKFRKALEGMIKKPLEKEGIDEFAVTLDKGKNFVTVNKFESRLFHSSKENEKIIIDEDIDMVLYLEDISFNEDKSWTFSNGNNIIKATIEDNLFLQRIDNREINFAKGDILKAVVNIQQWVSSDKVHTSYKIIKVNQKIEPEKQLNLLK